HSVGCDCRIRESPVRSTSPAATTPATNAVGSSTSSTSTPASPAAPPAPATGISEKYVKYATGLVGRYDSNKDGMLTVNEWKEMSMDVAPADKDGNGQVTINELGAFMQH
ncbi:MAG: hypothetical protein ACC628_06805, partial [Pirellulaceae bacterium]